jgi:hypothetical protein
MRVRLVSDSCAKGWTTWGHGELWTTEDALIRIGKKKPTPPMFRWLTSREEMDVSPDSWAHYLATHEDVQVLAYDHIVRARLTAGVATTSLALRLREGIPIRLLWKRDPQAVRTLRSTLPAIMGHALRTPRPAGP